MKPFGETQSTQQYYPWSLPKEWDLVVDFEGIVGEVVAIEKTTGAPRVHVRLHGGKIARRKYHALRPWKSPPPPPAPQG